jgi:hypothetical protein
MMMMMMIHSVHTQKLPLHWSKYRIFIFAWEVLRCQLFRFGARVTVRIISFSEVCSSKVLFCFLQLTVLNAGRKYLGLDDLSGKVFVTSGLGGMSGAQAKAAVIAGCIGVIAEVRNNKLFRD